MPKFLNKLSHHNIPIQNRCGAPLVALPTAIIHLPSYPRSSGGARWAIRGSRPWVLAPAPTHPAAAAAPGKHSAESNGRGQKVAPVKLCHCCRHAVYNYGDTSFGGAPVLMGNNNAMLDNAIGRVDAIVDGPNSGDPGPVLEQYSYLGLLLIRT